MRAMNTPLWRCHTLRSVRGGCRAGAAAAPWPPVTVRGVSVGRVGGASSCCMHGTTCHTAAACMAPPARCMHGTTAQPARRAGDTEAGSPLRVRQREKQREKPRRGCCVLPRRSVLGAQRCCICRGCARNQVHGQGALATKCMGRGRTTSLLLKAMSSALICHSGCGAAVRLL
jgi:hypothetical protein